MSAYELSAHLYCKRAGGTAHAEAIIDDLIDSGYPLEVTKINKYKKYEFLKGVDYLVKKPVRKKITEVEFKVRGIGSKTVAVADIKAISPFTDGCELVLSAGNVIFVDNMYSCDTTNGYGEQYRLPSVQRLLGMKG